METHKQEEVNGRDHRNVAAARASIAHFLEEVYHRQHLHSAPLRLVQPPAPDSIAPTP